MALCPSRIYCCNRDTAHDAVAGDCFISSPAFGQQLTGYVFAKRDQGLGYYKDVSTTAISAEDTDKTVSKSALQDEPTASNTVSKLLKPRLRTRAAAEELD